MNVIDLTHTVCEDMLVYPGTEQPIVREACSLAEDGFKETKLDIFSHVGTHIDAPAHLFADGVSLDAMPAAQFVGKALVVDCRDVPLGGAIGMAQLAPYGDLVAKADFLLFCTGFDEKWGSDAYFGAFPCLDDEVLDLVIKGRYKGIGSDTMSMDPMSDVALPRHKKLLGSRDIINIENLKNLALCGDALFDFACLPLKFTNADGAPARAVACLA